jgi:prepilin-type N-terminal cleavage/methylation domain-containing protein
MKRKNEQGFTLVEVIVVAVIVAVLAAVAIPLYNGYIRDSRNNVCQNNAASIASTFTAALQQDAAFVPGNAIGNGGATVTVPAQDPAGPPNIIQLPAGYVAAVAAGAVTVTGPGGSTSTAVPFQ